MAAHPPISCLWVKTKQVILWHLLPLCIIIALLKEKWHNKGVVSRFTVITNLLRISTEVWNQHTRFSHISLCWRESYMGKDDSFHGTMLARKLFCLALLSGATTVHTLAGKLLPWCMPSRKLLPHNLTPVRLSMYKQLFLERRINLFLIWP